MTALTTQQHGAQAEHEARIYLEQRGLVFVTANWRAQFHKQVGEIDLVMRDAEEWVFVEVRARSRPDYGGAAASVNHAKQLKLRRAAEAYLYAHRLHNAFCRFDVMAREATQWHWYRHAFSL